MKKVGFFGGAFNPVTLAHVRICREALAVVDEVWMTPCYGHMFGKQLEHPDFRLDMCQLATRSDPQIKVFNYEIKYELEVSTYEILTRLKSESFMRDIDLYYIIGEDNAIGIRRWKHSEELRETTKFITVPRYERRDNSVLKGEWFCQEPNIFIGNVPPIFCSSTMARTNLRLGDMGGIIDPVVREYALHHNLYEIYLFCLSDGNPENNIYIYSGVDDEDYIRNSFNDLDHGGMPIDIWSKVIKEGKITKLTSLDEVPPEHYDYLPYNGHDIEEYEIYVGEFLTEKAKV